MAPPHQNRRSGYNYYTVEQPRRERPLKLASQPKKWFFKERSKPLATHKIKHAYVERTPALYHSSLEPLTATFKSLDATSQALQDQKGPNDNVKLDRTGERDYLFSEDNSNVPLRIDSALVESREPVVAVYTAGERQQFSQSEKRNDKTPPLSKSPPTVHSKFAIENLSLRTEKQPIKAYVKALGKPYFRSDPNRLVNDSAPDQIETFSRENNKIPLDTDSPKIQRLTPHFYQKQSNNGINRLQPSNHFVPGKPPPKSLGTSVLNPPRRNSLFVQKPPKEKGFFDNVSSFATNFFERLLPKPSPSPTSSPPALTRRHRHNPPPPPHLNLIPEEAQFSPPAEGGKPRDRSFDPSPQQGIIAEDVFQPIFVPSYSMDEKLPKNAMKPLILPQERKAEAPSTGLSKPKLIDFF